MVEVGGHSTNRVDKSVTPNSALINGSSLQDSSFSLTFKNEILSLDWFNHSCSDSLRPKFEKNGE